MRTNLLKRTPPKSFFLHNQFGFLARDAYVLNVSAGQAYTQDVQTLAELL